MADIVLATIGKCIYCGATEPGTPLETEHVVPYALGGNHVLRKASCRACADITKKIEHHVCRKMLGPVRVQLGYQTRRPKDRGKPFKVRFLTDHQVSNEVEVPASEVPAMLSLPVFERPGISRVVAPTKEISLRQNGFWGSLTNPEGIQAFHNVAKLSSGRLEVLSFEPWKFALMLAKIGHCAAMARFHHEQFVPFLPSIIRSNNGYLGQYVGTSDGASPVFQDRLYDVSTVLTVQPPGGIVFATVQLFANLGGPVYEIVTGLLTDTPSQAQPNVQERIH